jgi:hypothetical protein
VAVDWIRAYLAADFGYPENAPEIQNLRITFSGSGRDLYRATREELIKVVGNTTTGNPLYVYLGRSLYSKVRPDHF